MDKDKLLKILIWIAAIVLWLTISPLFYILAVKCKLIERKPVRICLLLVSPLFLLIYLVIYIFIRLSIGGNPFDDDYDDPSYDTEYSDTEYSDTECSDTFFEGFEPPRDTIRLKRPNSDLMVRAENGDADAQYQVGGIFVDAFHCKLESSISTVIMEGEDDFYGEALKWLTKAARQNHVNAQISLAYLYLHGAHSGLGGDTAFDKSKYWIERAAKTDSKEGMNALGSWHLWLYEDCGLQEDAQHAAYYFLVAARNGHADAQYNLGICYKNGIGVSKSLSKARHWLEKAKAGGNEDASRLLETLDEQ